MKNWKTTALGIFALLLGVLKALKPDLFTEEVLGQINQVLSYLVDAIFIVLALVAGFSAKDEMKASNL